MLKYLNDTVEKAVTQAEVDTPSQRTIPSLAAIGRETPSNLCGFEMPEELVREDRLLRTLSARRERIKGYRNDAANLTSWLDSIGIEPIAVITAKAFDQLVTEAGLFTLQPTTHGTVAIHRTPILALRVKDWVETVVHTTIFAVVFAVFIWGFSSFGWDVQEASGPGAFIGMVATLAACELAVCLPAVWLLAKINGWVFTRRAAAWVDSLSWADLLLALTGGTRKFASGSAYYETEAFTRQVVLPPAPPEVLDKVCRMLSSQREDRPVYNLYIAAEPNAIQFKDGLAGLFDHAAIQKVLDHEEMLRRDPILFVRGGGSAVAIIAQYGDLAIEKAMIDKVINSEHLL